MMNTPHLQATSSSSSTVPLTQRQGGIYFPQFNEHAQKSLNYANIECRQLFKEHTPFFNNMVTQGMKFSPSDELSHTMQQGIESDTFPFRVRMTPVSNGKGGYYAQLLLNNSIDPDTGKLKPDFAHVIKKLEGHIAQFIKSGMGERQPRVPFEQYPPDMGVEDLEQQLASKTLLTPPSQMQGANNILRFRRKA
jgi:hypothetical protein